MNDDTHALFSMRFNGEGGVSEDSSDESAFLWRHIDIVDGDTEAWLIEELGIDPVVSHALVTEDTRPRSLRVGTGIMFIMRGFNFNEGADIDDLVSLRMWVDGDRAVTLRHRRLFAPRDVKAALENGLGPKDAGEFMVAITDALASRMAEGVHNLEARADDVEEEVLLGKPADLRERLADLRRELIGVRRHLGPQRDALTKLFSEELPWLTSENRARLREVINQTTRYVEELDTARERAAITQEELNARIAEQMNTRMYALSVTAAIFLPLGLLTGLLGINVGGIPGSEHPAGFAAVCGLLLLVAILQISLYRKLRWL
jgi:zinc transporter